MLSKTVPKYATILRIEAGLLIEAGVNLMHALSLHKITTNFLLLNKKRTHEHTLNKKRTHGHTNTFTL